MIETVSVVSYAKINLHLDVGSIREDSFHEIYSFFKTIALHDEMLISISQDISKEKQNKKFIEIKGNFSCSEENNLIYKAAIKFMEKFGSYFSVRFDVNKIIPDGGGLGGGSSNAAAVLKALNSHFSNFFSNNELKSIASLIGSDIPFFLEDSTVALVTGKGEIVEPIYIDMPEYLLLLVYPGFKVKTAEAYSWLDSDRWDTKHSIEKIDKSMLLQCPSNWKFSNSFTKPLVKRFNIYNKIFSVFNDNRAGFYDITGSGSVVYGVFADRENLDKACCAIKRFCPNVWITNTLVSKSR
ncbi:MAG: 4-(cytidine 5'-diphospho)-2-C-methyl-D-erythritol kinase [Spirochaetes bacterium]|nr:4-(cytidine 5'-diphospho)-2-C-methyl-D-erythritol kinase [Spirochaetota bacterium]